MQPFALNLVALALSGLTGIIAGLVLRQINAVARDVKDISKKVGEHAEKLARGSAEIEELQRLAEKHDAELRKLAVEGCARGRDCWRSGT